MVKCKLQFSIGLEPNVKTILVSRFNNWFIIGWFGEKENNCLSGLVEKIGAESQPRPSHWACGHVTLPPYRLCSLNGTNVLWLSDETIRNPEWLGCLSCQSLFLITRQSVYNYGQYSSKRKAKFHLWEFKIKPLSYSMIYIRIKLTLKLNLLWNLKQTYMPWFQLAKSLVS